MQQEFELKLVHFIQIHKSSVYKSLYITIPTPLKEFRPRNLEQGRVFLLHFALKLPSSFFRRVTLPKYLDQRYSLIP